MEKSKRTFWPTQYFMSHRHTHTLTDQYLGACVLLTQWLFYRVILFKMEGKPMGALSYDGYSLKIKSYAKEGPNFVLENLANFSEGVAFLED